MNISEIIKELTQERGKLDAAIQALEGVGGSSVKRRGRPPGSINKQTATSAPKKRRTMSAAARKLISEAQKARWAKQKRAAK
jgi:hypothetical protein